MLDKKVFTKKRYKIVGRHSAVKICSWTRNSLVNKYSFIADLTVELESGQIKAGAPCRS